MTHLKAFVLDEFFNAVNDEKIAIVIIVTNVTYENKYLSKQCGTY